MPDSGEAPPHVFFSISGKAKGKGRGTPVQRGRHLAIVSGADTEAYQNRIAMSARTAMRELGLRAPMAGALELRILIRMAVPKSVSGVQRQKMLSGDLKPTKKPDSSNVIKAVEDGCNGVVWMDDAQITLSWVRKVYAEVGGVDVRVSVDSFRPA